MVGYIKNLECLLPPTKVRRIVSEWLEEDCPALDVGGLIVGTEPCKALLLGKGKGILAGVPFFNEVFRQLDCTVVWHKQEGHSIDPVEHCASVRGPANLLLLGERVALNILARCSGIATKTNTICQLLPNSGKTRPVLAGTRKTTPGFRLAEKYAMLVGGADPHRYSLSTMTMLKDNHLAAAPSLTEAVKLAKSAGGFSTKVEVEVGTIDAALEAVAAGADVIMLDNFNTYEARKEAIDTLKMVTGSTQGLSETQSRPYLLELSGGIDEENICDYSREDVDIISTSAIHQGVKHVDFSLKILPGAQ
ncbi:MAG: hypothetical protein M1814_002537 [Vezdaea aestivalis]|nr:MAG: hypothetical protein M1814_002537 [Vezdaea aestivalis]